MPIERLADAGLTYHLVCFDGEGHERTDDPDGLMGQKLIDLAKQSDVTDVFLLSHGWMQDIPAAKRQYGAWIKSMAGHGPDLERARKLRAGFEPLLVGLHWPSLPFGEEELGGQADVSFSSPSAPGAEQAGAPDIDQLVQQYASRLARTPAAIEALRTIFAEAIENVAPTKMPAHVVAAYETLDREAALGSEGVGAAPGADRESFDPSATYRQAEQEMVSFGGFGLGGLLAPLRTMSFWKMKDRACTFGATAVFDLLCQLQNACADNVRFHLMGHSFGCVVMSSALAGPKDSTPLPRPVHCAALMQGALSLWSFAAEIPHAAGRPGYFHRAVGPDRVSGPLITTQSEYDTAVGRMYPLAAGFAGQVDFAPGELPKYGAVGTFGVRGPGLELVDLEIGNAERDYGFQAGHIYNIDSSRIIRHGGPPAGAHSDLAHAEVAHTFWEAVLSGLN